MTVHQVIVRFYNEAHHCGRTTDGRDFLAVGCAHRSPRAAVDHADLLAGDQSEGRVPGTAASAPASSVAPPAALDAGPSPDPTASEGSSGVSPLLPGPSLDAGHDPVSAGRGSELVEALGP